jgi:hypothetical protein
MIESFVKDALVLSENNYLLFFFYKFIELCKLLPVRLGVTITNTSSSYRS